jgi:serine/threonine protein kinase
VRIAKAVLHALVHAHGSGILHCDLKPANVLLDADFEPRLCDFGQSRLSDEQKPALGTLFYMAPEQADLKAVPDARWDVYALGALLYHMLSGDPPFRTAETERIVENAETLEARLAAYRRLVRQGALPIQLHTGSRQTARGGRRTLPQRESRKALRQCAGSAR